MAKGWALSTGNLPQGDLPRNSVDRITDCPDIIKAVDRRRKALTKINKQTDRNHLQTKKRDNNEVLRILRFIG